MHQEFEPDKGDELLIERTGVRGFSDRAKLHYVADGAFFTICGRSIREFGTELPLVRDGKPILHDSMCGHCQKKLNSLYRKGVRIRMLRVPESVDAWAGSRETQKGGSDIMDALNSALGQKPNIL
jgi:hypothetical protein